MNITLELTSRCNLRCVMCSLWRQGYKELPFEQIIGFLNNYSKLSVALTGGEPFLYSEFDKLFRYLLRRAIGGEIYGIHISSNGTLPELKEFVLKYRKYAKWISLTFSIDGLKEIHDKQRGIERAFEATVRNLMSVRKNVPELEISIKMVLTRINQKHVKSVWNLGKYFGIPVYFKVVESLPVYYQREGDICIKDLTPNFVYLTNILEEIVQDAESLDIYRNNHFLMFSLKCLLRHIMQGDMNFIDRCNVPNSFLFIDVLGNILPCLYMRPVGTLSEGINEGLYASIIEKAVSGECPKCMAYHGFLQECNLDNVELML